MTDPDRGAYTPQTDAPLSFDARRPRGGASGGGGGRGPAPFTLIISAVVLVVLVGAIFMFYKSGVRGANEAPKVVGNPVDAVKAPPPASAQPNDAAPPLDVYNAGADQTAGAAPPVPAFTPAPEQPMARPAPPALPPPAPKPTTPVAAAPLRPAQTAPLVAPAPPAPVALKPAVTPTAKPAPAPTPAPAPALKPAVAATAKPVPAPAAPKPAVVASSAPAAKPAGPGGVVVQIGAFTSAALADKGWADTARLLPGQTVGKTKKIEPVVKGTATLYRAYVGGFASRADAEAYCTALKAQGKQCFVKG